MDKYKLIKHVQEMAVLWDQKHPLYYDRDYKQKVWEEIAKNFNTSGEDARRRWESIRDNFRKELKKKKSKWIYFKSLTFLKDVMLPPKSITNKTFPQTHIIDFTADQSSKEGESETQVEDVEFDEDNEEILWLTDEPEEESDKVRGDGISLKRPPQKSFDDQTVELEKKKIKLVEEMLDLKRSASKTEGAQAHVKNDDDYYFCLSIVPYLRKLNDIQKFSARIKIMDVLKKELELLDSTEYTRT